MYVHVIILTGLGEQVSSHVHNTLHDTVVYFQEIEIKVMEYGTCECCHNFFKFYLELIFR